MGARAIDGEKNYGRFPIAVKQTNKTKKKVRIKKFNENNSIHRDQDRQSDYAFISFMVWSLRSLFSLV